MKEQAVAKINKVGKISYIITIICRILVILGLICCVAATVLLLLLPRAGVTLTSRGTVQVEMDVAQLGSFFPVEKFEEIQKGLESGEQMMVTEVRNGMVNADLEITSSGQRYVPVAVDVNEGSVIVDLTTEEATIDLRDMAWLMFLIVIVLLMSFITLVFIGSLCKAFRDCASPFEEHVIKKMHNLAICLIPWALVSSIGESLADSAMSGGMQWSISIDLGVVLVVMIVLILVYIFKYGAVLQQESDETL